MGEADTALLTSTKQQVIVPAKYMGSLFKSQNGSTWDVSVRRPKFTINRCKFVTEPGVFVLQPSTFEANDKIETRPNPILHHLKKWLLTCSAISTTD